MIPTADVQPEIPSPLPGCTMPASDEISEEGFGWFRSTWFIGRVPIAEAVEVVQEEGEIITELDTVAADPLEFELLAAAIESGEAEDLPGDLRRRAEGAGLASYLDDADDVAAVGGLEIGVSGLTHALSAVGCLTAASCRSHATDRSWSDCPVIFFAAPAWRLAILAELIRDAGCGLDADRGMLQIYAPSIREMHRLANLIVQERVRFRKRPAASRPARGHNQPSATKVDQFSLLEDPPS